MYNNLNIYCFIFIVFNVINMIDNSSDQRFKMLKKHHTQTLQDAIDNKKADELIIPFLLEVTKIPDIFTSSSCAGRIMLLSTDEYENKKVSSFHKRYHRLITFEELKTDLNESTDTDIWFKMEPFIFHFVTKYFEKARDILSFCQSFGLKKAGIITAKDGKFILEVTSTQYLALPLKVKDEIIVSDSYLELLVDRANKKLTINYDRLKRFEIEFLAKYLI